MKVFRLETVCRKIEENWDAVAEPRAAKARLDDLSVGKRDMLEACVFVLQEGDAFLQDLDDLLGTAPEDRLDSRPDLTRRNLNLAVGQVTLMPIKCNELTWNLRQKHVLDVKGTFC